MEKIENLIEEAYGNTERACLGIFPSEIPAQDAALTRSLAGKFRKAGIADPVTVDEYYQIVENGVHVSAARLAGLKSIPVLKKKAAKRFEGFPNRLLIEVSNKCNLECVMCPAHGPTKDMKREKVNMSFDLFKKAIDEISGYPKVDLLFHFFGEPLLNTDLSRFFDYLNQKPSLGHLLMSTNGMLLNERAISVLLDSPLHILQVSLNASTPETYKMISGGADQQRVVRNVEAFLAERQRRSLKTPLLRVQMVEMDCNEAEMSAFISRWEGIADLIHVNKFEKQGGRVLDQRSKNDLQPPSRFFCDRLRRKDFVVYSNGLVSACVYDYDGYLALGNLNHETIKGSMASKKYRDLVKAHQTADLSAFPICATCTDWML